MVLTPYEETIGNIAEDVRLGLITAAINNDKLLILCRREGLTRRLINKLLGNRHRVTRAVTHLRSPHIRQIHPLTRFVLEKGLDWFWLFLYPVYRLLRKLSGGTVGNSLRMPTFGRSKLVPRWTNGFKIKPPTLPKITKPFRKNYIVLHVRTPGFYGEDKASSDYRSADIGTYLTAIRAITDAGLWVVRIGDRSMPRLPVMKHVIDYPFGSDKSDLMDFHLIQNCEFYMGMDSGPMDVARLFGKPMFLTNVTNWTLAAALDGEYEILFKRFYDKKSGNRMELADVIKVMDNPHMSASAFDPKNCPVDIVDNTHEEILEATRQMLRRFV